MQAGSGVISAQIIKKIRGGGKIGIENGYLKKN